MIRKTCCALLPFQAGLLIAFLIGRGAWIAVFPVMGIAMLFFGFCRSKRAYAAVISLSMCAGIAASCIYTAAVFEKTIAFDGQSAAVKGYVYDKSEYDGGRYRITVKGRINGGASVKVGFYVTEEEYSSLTWGDDVTVTGVLYKIADSTSNMSARSRIAGGYYLTSPKADSVAADGHNSHRLLRFARQLREHTYDTLADKGGEGGRYLGAIICGDRRGVDETISEEMYRAGIGHIFAFSGTHIAIMISAAAVFLGTFSKRRAVNTAALITIAWGLVLFSGLSVSAIRAAIMMSVMLLSTLAVQRSDPLTSLAVAGFLICIVSPYSIASNSYILSFAGAFACSAYADALGERMHKDKTYPPVGSKRTLIAVFCTGLLQMPINALLFGRVSIISPLTNFLMLPICSLSMIMALIGLLISFIPVLSGAMIWYASVILKGCITITGALSRLPFASVCTYHIAVKCAVIFICILPILLMILPYKHFMLAGVYVLSSALMLGVSTAADYSQKDKLHIIIYSRYGSDALVVYDTEGAVFASYDSGRQCFEGLESLYQKRGLRPLDGVVCRGDIPDMPLMTDMGTEYSSEGYLSAALGETQAQRDNITLIIDSKSVVIHDKKVYNYIDGYEYELDDNALELIYDKNTGECTARRLDSGFDITV
ncbi:MAG: ComEC/Rec2 family competence protein [Ruminococcus sp.]|nr:ComEC/Rec2 family competence protein [Ruminococcus sp.]